MRIIIACPEAHVADANQWARVLSRCGWQPLCGGQRRGGAKVSGGGTESDWDTDMAAAARAQALIRLVWPEQAGNIPLPLSTTDVLTCRSDYLGGPVSHRAGLPF